MSNSSFLYHFYAWSGLQRPDPAYVFYSKPGVLLREPRCPLLESPSQAALACACCSTRSASNTAFAVWIPKKMYRISVIFILASVGIFLPLGAKMADNAPNGPLFLPLAAVTYNYVRLILATPTRRTLDNLCGKFQQYHASTISHPLAAKGMTHLFRAFRVHTSGAGPFAFRATK